MTGEQKSVSSAEPLRGRSSRTLPGEHIFSVVVPLSYAFVPASGFVGLRYELSLWWVAGTMLVAGAASAVRVGFFPSGIVTSFIGFLTMLTATLAIPEVTLPVIAPVAAVGIGLTLFGMRRTERLRADWPRTS